MANGSIHCSCCHDKIAGLKYTHSGKVYCYACYQKLQEQLALLEAQKQDLYTYIKDKFGIAELPDEIISFLDREVQNGKRLQGMRLTLKYYYDIEGHDASNVTNIIYVIRDQYDAAKKYLTNVRAIQARNAAVSLDVPPVNITLSTNALQYNNHRNAIKTDIEDL